MTAESHRILALVPNLRSERGHYYSFHKALDAAAGSLGWDYIVAAPMESTVSNWPTHWQKCLDLKKRCYHPRFIAKLFEKYAYRSSLAKFLCNNCLKDTKNILLIEDPSERRLKILLKSLSKKPIENLFLWIHFHIFFEAEKICQALEELMASNLLKGAVFTAETEPMALEWQKLVGATVICLPWPTIQHQDIEPFERHDQLLHCWWPGPPSPWKGKECIQRLLSIETKNAKQIRLVCSEEALLTSSGNAHLHTLPAMLTHANYLRQMASTDLVLLPYPPEHFAHRLSASFLEVILLGRIPVVRPGTCMAYELHKYDLQRLIIDWESTELVSDLLKIADDPTIRAQIKKMQFDYQCRHSVQSVAKAMQELHGTKKFS